MKVAKKKKKKDGEELLGDLNKEIPEGDKPKEKRPVMDAEQKMMRDYVSAHYCSKLADTRKKISGDALKSHLWQKFTDGWFEQKSKPSNPKVEVKKQGKTDCSVMFQVKSAFKVKYPADHSSARGAVLESLRNVGFADKTAEQIYDENIDVEVKTAVRPFNELVNGRWISGKSGKEFVESSDTEKQAAQKLLALITDSQKATPLTNEERAVILTKTTNYVVKGGFMERAALYCKDADELRTLLTVITPQLALSYVKFAAAESEAVRDWMALNAFAQILGIELDADEDGETVAA
jgi:hypothetical protein